MLIPICNPRCDLTHQSTSCDNLRTDFQVDNSAWECPPGLGVCPLDVIFGTCKIIHNYLRSSEEHVVVSPEVKPRGLSLTCFSMRVSGYLKWSELSGTACCLGRLGISSTVMPQSAFEGTTSCIFSGMRPAQARSVALL